MSFGSDRSVKLTVGATLDGMVREFARGEQAGQRFSKTIQSSAKQSAKSLTQVKDSAKEVALPLLAIGTIAAAGFAYAVKSSADFEEKMSSVKSLSHATASEMGELRSAALTTGTAIGYSATQAADAEIELVKAGVSASDIYGGALSGSLKLAAAGQIDVADATSIAASTLTQFNLKGRDVGHVADLLAAGADKALGGVSDLGEGLKYIGPVAASAHVGLEQTVGSLALLAQNGILGEQAGTSLRGVLLSLTAPSQVAADVMSKYGISVYDASGKFVGFDGVAQQLQEHIGNLDDATRDQALGQIFGNAQITAATILMNGGAKAVDKWTKAVNEQGFATEQAVGKMDNLNGDLTKLKASFQTAGIVTGEAANGPLRAAVQVVTDLLDTYNSAPGAVQGVVLGVTALTAVVTLGSGAMLIAIPKVVAYGEALKTLSSANIPGVSKAADGLLTSTKRAGSALASTAGFLTGPWGIAMGLGAAGVSLLNVELAKLGASDSEVQNVLLTARTASDIYAVITKGRYDEPWVKSATEQFKDLDSVLSDFAKHNSGNFFEAISSRFTSSGSFSAINSLRTLNKEMAELANDDAPAAVDAFQKLAKQTDGSQTSLHRLIDAIGPDYQAALRNQASALGISATNTNLVLLATGKYEEAAKKAKNPTKENSDALSALQSSAKDAAQAIEDTSNALKDLTSPTLDARAAQRNFQAAVDAVTQSISDNGTTLDINTEKGRNNQAALDAIAQTAEAAAGAIYTQTGSQEQATAAMQSGRDELIKALGQYGITGAAAQQYADTIIGTPTDWATTFSNNAATSGNDIDGYKGKVNSVPSLVTTLFKVQGDSSAVDAILAKIRTARSEMKDLNGGASGNGRMGTFASGGQIVGPGTGTSDDVPIWASNREWIIRERSASMYGPQIMNAINQGTLSKSQLMAAMYGARGYASGGQVSRSTAQVRYAPASSAPVVVVQQRGADGPLIGSLTVPVPQGATVRETVDSVMFEVRKIRRGGRR